MYFKILSYIIIFLVSIFSVNAITSDPVILFSDMESAPKMGWDGSSTQGAAITIWGYNFGDVRGSSYVTVNGENLESNSDYAVWGEYWPTPFYQRITFWLNSGMQDGSGTITVTTNEGTSNSIPFTIRSGRIFFVIENANGDGSLSNPYGANQASNWINNVMQPGDVFYFRDGAAYDTKYNGGNGVFRVKEDSLSGTESNPISWIAYPGEKPLIDTSSYSEDDYPNAVVFRNNYMILSGFDIDAVHTTTAIGGDYNRIVGNDLEGMKNTRSGSGIVTSGNSDDHTGSGNEIVGNSVYGARTGNRLDHSIYVQGCADIEGVQVAHNYVHDNAIGRGPEIVINHQDDRCIENVQYIKSHFVYNNIVDCGGTGARARGISIYHLSESSTETLPPPEPFYVYNNLLVNCGVNDDSNEQVQSTPAMAQQRGKGRYYNNILYNSGNIGFGFLGDEVRFKNNIIHLVDSYSDGNVPSYFGTLYSTSPVTTDMYVSNNIFYGLPYPQYGEFDYDNYVENQNNLYGTDPQFISPKTTGFTLNDFVLQSGSPAIDFGTNNLELDGTDLPHPIGFDMLNNPRVENYDLGSIESGGNGIISIDAPKPVILFSDMESAPKTGWDGSNTQGAAITIWGYNFGDVRGSSYVTVNGENLESNSDYAVWGEYWPTPFYQKITFWLNSNIQDGSGTITVTTNEGTSNSIPFTIRFGRILFVESSGNGDGSYDSPYGANQASSWIDNMQAGDIYYFREGGQYTGVNNGASSILYVRDNEPSGTQNNPISWIGYPGEKPNIYSLGQSANSYVNGFYFENDFMVVSGFDFDTVHSTIKVVGTHARIIGNDMEGMKQSNAGSGNIKLGDQYRKAEGGSKIFGNNIYGGRTNNKLDHGIYIGGCAYESGSEIAWNYVSDNHFGSGAEVVINHQNNRCDSDVWVKSHFIYNNIIDCNEGGSRGTGISIFDLSEDSGETIPEPSYIYNNIILSCGEHNPSGNTITGQNSFAMTHSKSSARFYNNLAYNSGFTGFKFRSEETYFKNNIIHVTGSNANGQTPAYLGIENGNAGNMDLYLTNNIFYGLPYPQYGEFGHNNYIENENNLYGVDPLFVNPKTAGYTLNDFALQSTSQAIDFGTNNLELDGTTLPYPIGFDILNNPRVGNYDLGPIESGGSSSSNSCTSNFDCNDGLYCNGVETCNIGTGICQSGTPITCSQDSHSCTSNTCNEATDSCELTLDNSICDDGNVCTDNTCTINGCQVVNNANSCSDGNSCTIGDVCLAGSCQSGNLDLTCNQNPLAEYLIHAYNFDEGLGNAIEDYKGVQDGTINGATWTTDSNEGNSLDFNNNLVDLGNMDINSNEFTISTWFKPDNIDNQDPRIISKAIGVSEAQHYWMLGIDSATNNYLRFRLKTGGDTDTLVGNSQTVQLNVWQHAAATYDGSNMRLYLNGNLVGSRSQTGNVDISSSVPVSIGGNPQGERYFDGKIDDVRIYNKALTQTEVQNDMSLTYVINNNVPDPVCPNGVVEGIEACDDGVNPSQLCQYGLTECQVCTNTCTYTSGITSYCGDNVCDDSNEDINSCAQDCTPDPICGDGNIDSGLGETCDGTNYGSQSCQTLGYEHGSISCFNSGNLACTFDTSGCYNDFPQISLASPLVELSYGTTSVDLIISTSEDSTCKYGLNDVSFDSMNNFDLTDGTTHTKNSISLTQGSGDYTYYIRCRDMHTTPNENITTVTITVTEPPEIIPPVITNPTPNDVVLDYGTASTVVSVRTDENATCRYQIGPGISYDNMPESNQFTSSDGFLHELENFVLTDDTTYPFYVKCIDQYDNANTDDYYFNFSVGSEVIIEEPEFNLTEILSYAPLNEIDVNTNPVRIEIITKELATCRLSDNYQDSHADYNLFDGNLDMNDTLNYIDLDSTFFEKNKNNTVYVSCFPQLGSPANNTLGSFSFNLGSIINTTNETQPPVNEVPDDTGSSSGGGGGGSSSSSRNDNSLSILQEEVCKPDYTYPRWSTCLDGIQKRTITDDNGCEPPRTESRICSVKNNELENKFLNAKKLLIEKFSDRKRTYKATLTSSYNEIISSDNKLDDDTFVLIDEESGEEYLGRLVEENNDEYFYSLERIDESLLGELKAEGLVEVSTSEKIDSSFKDIFSSNYFKTGLFIFSLLLIIGFIYYVVIYIRKVHN